MTLRYLAAAFAVALLVAACSPRPQVDAQEGSSVSNQVVITAEVVEFKPDAIHDSFDDGFASYDATTLRITQPEDLRNTELRVAHDAPVAADSPWRDQGASVQFRIDRSLLDADLIFSGAAEDLRRVP
jgi:hypothetical protein